MFRLFFLGNLKQTFCFELKKSATKLLSIKATDRLRNWGNEAFPHLTCCWKVLASAKLPLRTATSKSSLASLSITLTFPIAHWTSKERTMVSLLVWCLKSGQVCLKNWVSSIQFHFWSSPQGNSWDMDDVNPWYFTNFFYIVLFCPTVILKFNT